MKKIFKLLGIVGMGCVAMTSCSDKDFLDVDQYDIISIEGEFENDDNALMGLTGVYDLMNANDGPDGDWGFKPNLFSGCHPTMDTQATGWDKNFNSQKWDATTTELNDGWAHAYSAIARANNYLKGLGENKENLSASVARHAEGEARAIRGFFYTYLAQTWGRVPMLSTEDDYTTAPQKEKASTYAEMWDFIIEDFIAADSLLDWAPMNGQYGRATKGMAKAYLADAYMWKAYRSCCDDKGAYDESKTSSAEYKKDIQLAYNQLKAIIDDSESGNKTYALNPSFCTNWDVDGGGWTKECIWAEILDEGGNYSGWSDRISSLMTKWYTACPEDGGWGSLYLSWEWYASYEHGDKRRDASCVTGAVPKQLMQTYKIEPSETNWGYHPFLQVQLGTKDSNGQVAASTKTKQFHFTNGEYAPAIWSTKFWRNASAEDLNGTGSWGWCMWSPTNIYWKRYSNVLIDCAECCFILGQNAEGWRYLDQVRKRAFGFNETNMDDSKYIGWFNTMAGKYGKSTLTKYPIPFGPQISESEYVNAETYYTKYAKSNIKGKAFSSAAWKVAVNEERRKEFNCEWCLRPDMQRSGFMKDHIETNYPKDATSGDTYANYPWTYRDFDYNELKMDMPIPQDEIDKNPKCTQNPAYTGTTAN